jgi:hypothetical protein
MGEMRVVVIVLGDGWSLPVWFASIPSFCGKKLVLFVLDFGNTSRFAELAALIGQMSLYEGFEEVVLSDESIE